MEHKQIDFKYVQQHLANERTFLAWVRTAITVIGLGFLAAGVVFRTTTFEHIGHTIAAIVGIGILIVRHII
jgi:putative membrane protein